jgi:hypothetical protein
VTRSASQSRRFSLEILPVLLNVLGLLARVKRPVVACGRLRLNELSAAVLVFPLHSQLIVRLARIIVEYVALRVPVGLALILGERLVVEGLVSRGALLGLELRGNELALRLG